MPTLMYDKTEREERPLAPTTFIVHIKRPDVDMRDPALCGDRYGAHVVADEDEAIPYIIGRVETLCPVCKAVQFTV